MPSGHFFVIKCEQLVTLGTMQPIFLLSGMGTAPIPGDVKLHLVVIKCERSHWWVSKKYQKRVPLAYGGNTWLWLQGSWGPIAKRKYKKITAAKISMGTQFQQVRACYVFRMPSVFIMLPYRICFIYK